MIAPIMMFLVGLMALFTAVAVVCWVVSACVFAVQWIRGKAQCGWGWWAHPNDDTGYCGRRLFHLGSHVWTRDWKP